MLNIKVISDTHGYLPDLGKIDLLLIAGDICPAGNHRSFYQGAWLNGLFISWINHLDYTNDDSRVVLVPGNHDFIFDFVDEETIKDVLDRTNGRLVLLRNEEYNFKYKDGDNEKSIKIFGTPYCKVFGRWAFMRPDDELEKLYSQIPDDVDIIVSHDAADLNGLGQISDDAPWGPKNAGNKVLAKYVIEKKPKYYFCGHIHSGNHNFCSGNGIMMANVSYVGEDYKPRYKTLEFDYEEEIEKQRKKEEM